MKDTFGREIDYLRVSVTDRCNLRCKYCMPEDLPDIPHTEILRYEEILRVCEAAAKLGIRNFRVTGGEPLVRLGCVDFLREMKKIPGAGKLMITTNGVLLEPHLQALRDIGVDSLNISLDTMDREAYLRLTGADAFDKVFHGIEAAVGMGLRVKINCVSMRGVNEDSFMDIAALAERYPVDVRFIESMPIGAGGAFEPVPGDELAALLRRKYPGLAESGERRGFGPAAYYAHERLQGQIGLISAVSHGFCDRCNRLRLTSDGLLKACLYFGQATDMKPILRRGGDAAALGAAIRDTVNNKPEKHLFRGEAGKAEQRKMSQIGG